MFQDPRHGLMKYPRTFRHNLLFISTEFVVYVQIPHTGILRSFPGQKGEQRGLWGFCGILPTERIYTMILESIPGTEWTLGRKTHILFTILFTSMFLGESQGKPTQTGGENVKL